MRERNGAGKRTAQINQERAATQMASRYCLLCLERRGGKRSPSSGVTESRHFGKGLNHRDLCCGVRRRWNERHVLARRHPGPVEIAGLDVRILEREAVGRIQEEIVHPDDATGSKELQSMTTAPAV